ncbi:MAG: hemolysin family protein [Treponema sp.]|nr:hemolysin family protein [Treponema sp.]
MLFNIIVLVILILISGMLSSSEIALSSSNRNKVKLRADKGEKKAIRLLKTIEKPHTFFATTQLYITFIAFFSGAYAASSFTDPIAKWILEKGFPVSANLAETLVFIFITAILTYVSLIFGELVPKRIAMKYAIPFSLGMQPVLKALSIIALPFVKFLSASAKLILKLIRFKDDSNDDVATKEEIRMIVHTSSEQGEIAESEHGMINNIFKIDKLIAGDICKHRLEVIALPIDVSFETVMEMLKGEFYTRIPVYYESIDDIKGILYTKDVLRYLAANKDTSSFDIKQLIREAYFVPFSIRADELFQDMQKEHVYFAIVVDEYGGTLGIITMEDLVVKIVGKIHDEYDAVETPDIVPAGENTFKISGTASLEKVQNHFDIPLPIDEYETLSGFLIGQLKYIPAEDEKPEVTFNGLLFKVEKIKDLRIVAVKVTKIQ